MNNQDLVALANAMATQFDQGLENGTLNDALAGHDKVVAQVAPVMSQQSAELLPAQVLKRFTESVLSQITNMQKKHESLVDILPIAVIAAIMDEYIKAGFTREAVYTLVNSLYDSPDHQ